MLHKPTLLRHSWHQLHYFWGKQPWTIRRCTLSSSLCQLRKHNIRLEVKVYKPNTATIRYINSSSPQKSPLIHITRLSVMVSALLSAALFGIYIWLEQGKQLQKSEERMSALVESGIGTLHWSLTDQYGKRRQFSEFRGQWVMLYFGFCHCPDICPEEIEKLVKVVQGIDNNPKAPSIQPIYITLDPERDTVQYMNKYCKDFSNKLIGLTGSAEEIAEVAKSYRVYYGKGEPDTDGDYIIDHTICMYLINPDGQLIDVYERRFTADSIINGSLKHMVDYVKLKRMYGSDS